MRVVLEKPISWLESLRDGERHQLMYTQLKKTLEEQSLDVEEQPVRYGNDMRDGEAPDNGFRISYHSVGFAPYVWRLKETPVPYYYSVDRRGHSGWSELSRLSPEYSGHYARVNALERSVSEEYVLKLRAWLIRNNLSKYVQRTEEGGLPGKFLFYPMQTMSDPVRVHDRISPVSVLLWCARYAKKHRRNLVIKRHPYCKSLKIWVLLYWLSLTNKWVILSDASVTKILPACDGVITGNSGVGFEALIYGKPVLSFSYSEYDMAVVNLNHRKDIENIFKGGNWSLPDADPYCYVHYFLDSICFDARKLESVKRVTSRLVDVVRERAW